MTACDDSISNRPPGDSVEILPFCGNDFQAISNRLKVIKAALPRDAAFDMLAREAVQLRQHFDAAASARLVLVLESQDDFHGRIDAALTLMEDPDVQDNSADMNCGQGKPPGALAFLFPGQGSQYVQMAADLFRNFPEAVSVRQAAEMHFQGEQRLCDFIYPETASDPEEKARLENALRQTDVAQPAIGLVSLLMMKILARFNIFPDFSGGHSFGELCALCAAGHIDGESLMELAVWRGRLMANAGGADKGTMLAVKAPLEQIESLILDNGIDVILANRNAPDQGVLSGATDAIEQMKVICKEHRIRAMALPVAAAFHSRLVEDAAVPFQKRLQAIDFGPGRIPVYANKTACAYPDDADAARRLLGEHLLNPVRFLEEIQNMYAAGARTFIEVGPKAVLTGLVKSILKGQPFAALSVDGSSGRRSGFYDLAVVLGRLAALGYPVDLKPWGKWD